MALVISGLFTIAVLFFLKEFSERVWENSKFVSVRSNELYNPDQQFLSVRGGYENIWKKESESNLSKKILPENRIIAYYGNLSSRGMGILGEYDQDEVLQRLLSEVDKWDKADPETRAIPALHYIATVAQASAGTDGKYRARMSSKQIDRVLAMAERVGAIVFLDIQIGTSDIESEVVRLRKYLELPQVHLGIDPEFAMREGTVPGTYIGTLSGDKINFAIDYLSQIVKEKNIPPKVLVVHRFTDKMITEYRSISPTPEVQVVINMDGFGEQQLKKNTYKQYVGKDPIDFTGFKIFYKNDVWAEGSRLMQPADVLKLNPAPVYIQYQ